MVLMQLTQPLLYADDTRIFYSHSNPNRVQSVLNDELRNYDMWLKCNKLPVNLKIIKPRQRIANDDFNISFGIELKQTNVTKFLGVYLDKHLTWKHDISFFIKANRKIRWYYLYLDSTILQEPS